jgi:hypothetical protein
MRNISICKHHGLHVIYLMKPKDSRSSAPVYAEVRVDKRNEPKSRAKETINNPKLIFIQMIDDRCGPMDTMTRKYF